MTMLKIWGRQNSCNVQKVMWLVRELDLKFDHIPAGGSFGGLNTPEFLTMNPHGHIPVIQDNNVIVWESHTILRYLAASYGKTSWLPAEPAQRAQIEQWMDWQQTALQPDFINGVFWNYYRTPESERDWNIIQTKIQCTNNHFLLLNDLFKKTSFVCDDKITLADIPIGTMLFRYFELDIERPHIPNVERWYKQLQERPAYKESVMIPFDELKGRISF